MTPQEQAQSFYVQALMQGYNETIALDMAKFAVDKIINYTELTIQEDTFWLEVLFYLESK